jgi:hypothetical protein
VVPTSFVAFRGSHFRGLLDEGPDLAVRSAPSQGYRYAPPFGGDYRETSRRRLDGCQVAAQNLCAVSCASRGWVSLSLTSWFCVDLAILKAKSAVYPADGCDVEDHREHRMRQ